MNIIKQYSLLAVPLLTCSMFVNASEDGKTYPGALCQPLSNTQAVLRDSRGRLLNNSNASQEWICPIVRETVGATSIEDAHMMVIDNNADVGDPNVRCRLRSSSENGALQFSEVHETAGDPGFTPLDYGVGGPNIGAVASGYYHFHCVIPGRFAGKRSGVASYRLTENVGEN